MERCDGLTRLLISRASRLRNLCSTCPFHLRPSFSSLAFRIIVVVIVVYYQTLASIAGSLSLASSWNGNEPSLISTAWERHAGGDIAVHQWKGLGKGGLNRLEDWVEVSAANADAGEGVGDDGRA